MANLRKWEIEQESIHDLVKPQMRWQRGEYWQNANFDKYGECAKNASRVWPIIQMRWQKGACWWLAIFRTMTNFAKMVNLVRSYQRFDKNLHRGKLGNNSFKVCQNSNEMTKEACRLLWVLQKWQIWQEFIKGLIKIKTRWRNRHVDNCGLYENDKCYKIREFGKDSSKVLENCLLLISENSNFGENGQFDKNLSKVWQKLKQDDKRRMWLIVGFAKMPFFAKSANFWKNLSKVWPHLNEATETGILYK